MERESLFAFKHAYTLKTYIYISIYTDTYIYREREAHIPESRTIPFINDFLVSISSFLYF